MKKGNHLLRIIVVSVSYFLVAEIGLVIGFLLRPAPEENYAKLNELSGLIEEYFIGESDKTAMEDGAAAGMIASLGDKWSYYIPADQYDAHMEQMGNSYVGIGVTISVENTEKGLEVLSVEPTGGAYEAGIRVGDILTAVNGQSVIQNGVDKSKELIRGKEGTQVSITFLREEQSITVDVTRKVIQVVVAEGQMLEGNIGLITIHNFDDRCASETIAAIETLLDQGAESLIFDVRNNPGGYKHELVEVLDYLLPAGVLFRSISHDGAEEIDESGESCLDIPMAVLINGNSYSAAEFFAAALEEYDWAVTVGEKTVGKSYYQSTFQFSDGSAVGLSIGKYCTPNGVSLAEVGGLEPKVPVEVDKETAAKIYAGTLEPEKDPQILAAVEALK